MSKGEETCAHTHNQENVQCRNSGHREVPRNQLEFNSWWPCQDTWTRICPHADTILATHLHHPPTGFSAKLSWCWELIETCSILGMGICLHGHALAKDRQLLVPCLQWLRPPQVGLHFKDLFLKAAMNDCFLNVYIVQLYPDVCKCIQMWLIRV